MTLYDPLIPASQAKTIIDVSNSSFYRLIAAGELHAVKIGRRTKIRQSELNRFIAARPQLFSRTGLKTA